MQGFNLKPATGKTCANKSARDVEKCGLYLPKRKDEEAEEKQEELF